MKLPWDPEPDPPAPPGPPAAPVTSPDAGDGEDLAPGAAEPARQPKPGEVWAYESHDAYASPPRDRVQLVMVTGVAPDGTTYGKALGFADDGACFAPGQLQAL